MNHKSTIYIFLTLLILCFLWPNPLVSQDYEECDNFALTIPVIYTESPEKLSAYIYANGYDGEEYLRVAYTWLCSNINYSQNTIDSLKNLDPIEYTFKTLGGKCTNYSASLTVLCQFAGIEAYSVLGYVKIDGKIITNADHAWNVIKIDEKYFLFDAAFDSELIKKENGMKYQYFKKKGEDFIQTHMPYDPIMQLQQYPATHPEFLKGVLKGKKQLDYVKAIESYGFLSEKDKLKVMFFRAESYGLKCRKLASLHKKLKNYVDKNSG
ncbi:MAG: transglutaminase domain-containing protein [Bacteroidales bacterium]|nr:transglutaminase domain-containing protein [Bacteroidales bacterium]